MAPSVVGQHLNLTPIWRVTPTSVSPDPWRRVIGAVQSGTDWLFPAYYPFGLSAAHDLKVLVPDLQWTDSALSFIKDLQASHKVWETAKSAYRRDEDVELPEDFEFPKGFEPYRHQRLRHSPHRRVVAFFLPLGDGHRQNAYDDRRLPAFTP
jgi:hypothetical protein